MPAETATNQIPACSLVALGIAGRAVLPATRPMPHPAGAQSTGPVSILVFDKPERVPSASSSSGVPS